VKWETGALRFRLRRIRPKGIKGPLSCWSGGDHWELYWGLKSPPPYSERLVDEKRAELREAVYRQTVKGKIEAEQRTKAYVAAFYDRSFQSMKKRLLATASGRRTKIRSTQGAQQ
jgi:hypothetical protein